jgi:hypothetical protein
MGVDSADDLSSLSFREVLKEAGISTNYDNCSSLGRKLAEYVTVVKDFPEGTLRSVEAALCRLFRRR